MISRSQNRQQVHCGYGLRKKKRAPHALCAILQSHEKTAGMVNHLKRHHGFLSKNNAWKDIILDSYFMQQFMSGRGGSGSTWGHVGSARVRSTSSRVEVDVGTPFKTSCRRSLATTHSQIHDIGVYDNKNSGSSMKEKELSVQKPLQIKNTDLVGKLKCFYEFNQK